MWTQFLFWFYRESAPTKGTLSPQTFTEAQTSATTRLVTLIPTLLIIDNYLESLFSSVKELKFLGALFMTYGRIEWGMDLLICSNSWLS